MTAEPTIEIQLARLCERAKALEGRMHHAEEETEKAVRLARSELERRLDILNHAHQQSLSDRAQYVTRAEMRWLIGIVVVLALAMIGYILGAR